jgi:uncharacterized membrane protein
MMIEINPRRREIVTLICCLLIGFALRFYTFDQKSLWIDEIHTFNTSKEGLKGQIKYFKEDPVDFLQPPLFFTLTHLFYPFERPERDLRIIPLIFGTLSIPMIYFLSRLFSPSIALPCTLSLAFMAYHISLSQDGRSYSMLMFFGMVSLYFFIKHLTTSKKRYLVLVALFFAILFHTSYSSIPFIALSQILWFYRIGDDHKKINVSSFLILNMTTLLLCAPWIIFLLLNYKGQPMMNPIHTEGIGSYLSIMYGVLHDWVPHAPLMIGSVILLIIFPFFSKSKKNALFLLAICFSPVAGLYLFCKLLNITHFITSKYFINFLPLFFISIYLSLHAIEPKFERLKIFIHLTPLFLILFIASNLVIIPLYYRSEKQDNRGLVTYLKNHLREGDNIFIGSIGYIPGILHYFDAYPEDRHWFTSFQRDSDKETKLRMSFIYQNKIFTVYHSKTCCNQYVSDEGRLWIVMDKNLAKYVKENTSFVMKGYFDGSFLNAIKFPTDASMYLFLWDPKSPGEKGIDRPIE